MHRFRYIFAFTLPILTWIGFSQDGWLCAIALIFTYIVFPILELVLPVDNANLDEKIAADENESPFYDWLLYAAAACYLLTFAYFFYTIANTEMGTWQYFCHVMSMGIIVGVFGFNVGHELTHRTQNSFAFTLGQMLLLGPLNLHFIPFHLGGHHRNVGKPTDPSTATRNEWLYTYWFKSQIGGYFEAWQIDNRITRSKGHSIFSLKNRMVRYTLVTIAYLSILAMILSSYQFVSYLIVALVSIALFETINYIEHYGLSRSKNEKGIYEPVRHHHSWNSDHFYGRAMMFNLSRHSDHHYNGSIKYQVLKSIPEAPQMPMGYPGMFVMAFVPPLWFLVMNKKLDEFNGQNL